MWDFSSFSFSPGLKYIWIFSSGFVIFLYGSGSNSFRHWLSWNQKKNFFLGFSAYCYVSLFTSVFKDIKSLQSHKRVEIRFFFVCWWKDLEPYKKLPIREAQKLMDSTDLAPEHCKYQKYSFQCKWSRLEQQVNNVQVYIMNMTCKEEANLTFFHKIYPNSTLCDIFFSSYFKLLISNYTTSVYSL